jgi:hypothetical protein
MSGKIRKSGLAVFLCVALSAALFQLPAISHGFEIIIQVSPSTLNLQNQGEVVTVHTSIAYSSVAGGTVTLNDVPISWWKADNQGNFVAKFLMTEVKALADSGGLEVPGENLLTLKGTTKDGAEFFGEQTITVINVIPSGTVKK